MITFRSVGHFFAKVFRGADIVITDVEKFFPVIEGVTAAVAPAAVPVESAGFAVLGEVASVLSAGGEDKLLSAGFDSAMIGLVKQLMSQIPQIVAAAKKL